MRSLGNSLILCRWPLIGSSSVRWSLRIPVSLADDMPAVRWNAGSLRRQTDTVPLLDGAEAPSGLEFSLLYQQVRPSRVSGALESSSFFLFASVPGLLSPECTNFRHLGRDSTLLVRRSFGTHPQLGHAACCSPRGCPEARLGLFQSVGVSRRVCDTPTIGRRL